MPQRHRRVNKEVLGEAAKDRHGEAK
jgi:hypothetical protein